MPKKKLKQLSNKQILMITLCILGAGMLMLVASILLAPSAEPSPVAQGESAVVAQSGTAQQPAKPTQSAQTQSQGTTSPKPAESAIRAMFNFLKNAITRLNRSCKIARKVANFVPVLVQKPYPEVLVGKLL